MKFTIIFFLACIIIVSGCSSGNNKSIKIKEEKVSIGNYSINYKDSGKGKHIILLEAGLGMDSKTWSDLQAKLSENYRVISYDRSGYGKSENSNLPRTIHNIAEDLKLLLEKIDAPPPYILVGHSLGGYVIRHFTELYPEKVSGIVMIDSYHERLFNMLKDSVSEIEWNRYLGTEQIKKDTLKGFESEKVEFMETVLSNESFKIPSEIPVHVLTSLQPIEDTSRFVKLTMDLHESLSLSFVTDNDNVNQTISKSSGHFIYLEEPGLVISAINNLVGRIDKKDKL